MVTLGIVDGVAILTLADPRRADMKDIVNIKIKFREPFRPFAPSVLAERAEEFFRQLPD